MIYTMNHMCVVAVLWLCVLLQYCDGVLLQDCVSVYCCSTVMVCVVAVL